MHSFFLIVPTYISWDSVSSTVPSFVARFLHLTISWWKLRQSGNFERDVACMINNQLVRPPSTRQLTYRTVYVYLGSELQFNWFHFRTTSQWCNLLPTGVPEGREATVEGTRSNNNGKIRTRDRSTTQTPCYTLFSCCLCFIWTLKRIPSQKEESMTFQILVLNRRLSALRTSKSQLQLSENAKFKIYMQLRVPKVCLISGKGGKSM